jgi:hypothetical protein
MRGAQIRLLKILGRLGVGDKGAADNMYAVLGDTLRRANTGHTIGNAIVAECVRTITAIYPNPALLQAGAPHPLPCRRARQAFRTPAWPHASCCRDSRLLCMRPIVM